jgi:hypothetical protein
MNGDWTEFRFILDMARDNAVFHDPLLGVGWLRQAVGVAQTAAVVKPGSPASLRPVAARSKLNERPNQCWRALKLCYLAQRRYLVRLRRAFHSQSKLLKVPSNSFPVNCPLRG